MARGFNNALMKALGATEHVMTVLSVEDLTPSYRRIRFHAPTMIDGRETPTASFIRMWAPDLEEPGRVHQRGYTLIDPDPKAGEITFDFVLHKPSGPASAWASAAKPGDSITASYVSYTKFEPPEPEPEGYLLIGDPSAIPAINEILRVLSLETPITVHLQQISEGDAALPITPHPNATISWTQDSSPEAIADAIPIRDWSNWRAWVAGESKMVKEVRARLNKQHGFPLADIDHRSYWIRGKAMRLRKDGGHGVDGPDPTVEAGRKEPVPPPKPTPVVAQPAPPGGRWRSQRGEELLQSVRWKMRIGGCAQALISLLRLVPLVLLAEIGRRLLAGQTAWDEYQSLVVAAVLFYGIAALLSALLLLWLHLVDAESGRELRRTVIAKLSRLPLGWFSERNSASARQAVQEDATRLHYMVTHAVPDAVAGTVTPLAVLIYLFTVDAGLAGTLFIPILAFIFTFTRMSKGSGDRVARLADWTKKANAAASAFVEALPVVRVFGGNGRQLREILKGQVAFLNGWQRPMAGWKALSQLVVQSPTFLLLILAIGVWRISAGMPPANLLPFLFLGTAFGAQILALMYGFMPLREARQAANRIGILLEEKELDRSRSIAELPEGPLGVSFRSVSFGYRPGRPVLKDISLDMRPGTLTAIVGPSGAGKSTLASLPGRFYDVTEGAILLTARAAEFDIRDLRPDLLQRSVGFVFQDVRLIRGTLRENIALSRSSATAVEIERAARAANIHDRILREPRGYDSVVGEDAHLSGGEAQRLSIARTLLADPPIVVLDEATAFADPESEHLVQQAISALTKDRTVLVVAHRLHTIVNAASIVVLDGGMIVQQGTHKELLARPGLYRDLWYAGAEMAA